jgi:hypothetical protein
VTFFKAIGIAVSILALVAVLVIGGAWVSVCGWSLPTHSHSVIC